MKSWSRTRAGHEGDLLRRLGGRDPVGDGRDLVSAVAEDVLEEDAKRVGKPRRAGVERVELVRLVAD